MSTGRPSRKSPRPGRGHCRASRGDHRLIRGHRLLAAPEHDGARNCFSINPRRVCLGPGEGSHQVYYHPDGRRVTVNVHSGGDTFRRKTLKSMIEQARWTEEDLRRLKLIR